MTRNDDIAFLKYFIPSYIPPFTRPVPNTREEYEDVFLSAYEIWGCMKRNIDRYPMPYDVKKSMVDLFALAREMWMIYLLVIDRESYRGVMAKPEMSDKWRKIMRLATNIECYYKKTPELKSEIIMPVY